MTTPTIDPTVVREEGAVLTGKCKAWNLEKGFGFATLDDNGPDLFIHQSAVTVEEGFRAISVGTSLQLTYTIRDGKPAGSNVCAVGGGPLPGYGTKLEASQKLITAPLAAKRDGATGGTVKWFDANKGYGFLTSDAGADVFVNIKDVEQNIPLTKEEPVDFFIEAQSDGRDRAMRVRSLKPNAYPAAPAYAPVHGYGATYAPQPAAFGYPASTYQPYQMSAPTPFAGHQQSDAAGGVGVCKWYNETKGFGFITPTDGSPELYFKGVDLVGGITTLEQGEQVRYTPKHLNGKSWAVNITSTRLAPKRAAPTGYEDPYAPAMKQLKTQHTPAQQPGRFDPNQQVYPGYEQHAYQPHQQPQTGYEPRGYEADPNAIAPYPHQPAYPQAAVYRQY